MLPEGSNAVVHGRGAIVSLEPVPAADVVSGHPRQGVIELGGIAGCEAGIWELRGGAVTDTEVDELFVVISGGAKIELLDAHHTVEVKAGDVMRLVAGTRTRWTVPDHIRKVYLSAVETVEPAESGAAESEPAAE
ncbi:cupin domain-containing protein [Leucobacter sp. CSA1]|uniref:Cupin domain-containing protein n=2 Tax=Leucobacter chromiisoli TaxID=2796471 RepID=A0A934UTV9_9MICO|nr:cupin domain-containing protein [Leucobacter chromiisoli]